MEELKKYIDELKSLSENIITNFKEDLNNISKDLIKSCSSKETVSTRKFVVSVPLPRDIEMEEKIECLNADYYVTYSIKCGLRTFNTTLYLGEKPSSEVLITEKRKCIAAAIQQCLDRDRGQLQEISESGNLINIQSL